jgi:putative nucleotidyltransferase with HDIG domain
VEPTPGGGYVIERAAGDLAAQAYPGARLGQGEGMTGLALDTGEVVSAPWPQDHPAYSPRTDDLRAEHPGFLCAPLHHRSVRGSLSVAGRPGGFGPGDAQALASLARTAAVALENALAQERAANFATHVSELLVTILEGVDVLNPGHSRHVAALADMMTRRLGLSDGERRTVHFAALLHDIGKIQLDSWMLRSPGKPTREDRQKLEIHPAIAVEILKPITIWVDILPIIHAHHERWDGGGYPRGLAGEDIPLGARVIAIADAFDAMTRSAAYGQVKPPETALDQLEGGAGTQFDPRLVRLFAVEYREHRDELPA